MMEETWFMAVQENSIVLRVIWRVKRYQPEGANPSILMLQLWIRNFCCHCDVQTHWKQKLIVTMEATALIKPTRVNITAVTFLVPTILVKLFQWMKHPQIARHILKQNQENYQIILISASLMVSGVSIIKSSCFPWEKKIRETVGVVD